MKSRLRIQALMMLMTLCLFVYIMEGIGIVHIYDQPQEKWRTMGQILIRSERRLFVCLMGMQK